MSAVKRALVTGAAGFIGANLVRRLAASGCEVHGVVRPATDTWRLPRGETDVRLHELTSIGRPQLESLVREVRPAWIFHLATHGAYSHQADADRIVEANLLMTIHLVEAALKVGFDRFVHTGSSSEYGRQDHAPREDEALAPNSTYAVAKAAATLYCCHAAEREKAPIATARLYSVYGPWEAPHRFIPVLLVHALSGRLPPLVAPDTARDFVFVDDAVGALMRLAEAPALQPGEVVNVGSGRPQTVGEVVAIVRRLTNLTDEPRWGSFPPRSWDTGTWVADVSRIGSRFGWAPTVTLEAGLARTLQWLRASADRLADYARRAREEILTAGR